MAFAVLVSLLVGSSTARLLHLIVPIVVSTLLEIVEVIRIDLKYDDDNIEVDAITERVHLACECLAASSLL